MFSNLMDKVFDSAAEVEATEITDALESVPEVVPVTTEAPETSASEPVDITASLDALNAKHAEDLDWRKSIVDLMKLVGMDSSYKARKELAADLGMTDYSGTAEDNIALHKHVMIKIAEKGGTVPSDIII